MTTAPKSMFAPELVDRLYIGPLDLTPAGQPISLVDLAAPDLARFPRFAEALPHAQVVTLEPGDALFIPSQWWHGVEGLDPINALV
ncbi:cupin-like domain-containing protein, partial [Acinetobacter baumannii]